MLFDKEMLISDIRSQFPDKIISVRDDNDTVSIIFRDEGSSNMMLSIKNDFTLYFDNWHGNYPFTDDEYERLLWDIRDILAGNAFALSVFVGRHLYLSYLARLDLKSADDFIDDDPRERYGLYHTGAEIECVYFDDRKNKKFTVEKRV